MFVYQSIILYSDLPGFQAKIGIVTKHLFSPTLSKPFCYIIIKMEGKNK